MDNPLREWRTQNKLRAVDVALKLGLSERAILAYETGAFKPTDENLAKLAKAMTSDEATLKLRWNDWLHAKAI